MVNGISTYRRLYFRSALYFHIFRISPSEKGSLKCANLDNPTNGVIILESRHLTLDDIAGTGEFVQISPQRVRLKLRLGEKEKIRFQVAQAKKYPVDIYYLMDLSNSMSDDRDTIVKLGRKIASTIENITRDFRIGFGSFVDKEVMPYISLVPNKNCQQQNKSSCPKPYSFQHHMSLSRDAELFQQRVQNAPISGNIDNPEGGFDALLQVMVCDDHVGWRKDARRVIIFTTDESFHIALDGKLGGLVTPNDGLCHLNDNGYYTYSTIQDYPSIGHINHLAKQRSFSIIWAVTEENINLYTTLAKLVQDSSAGTISYDSSNIVELIRQQYRAITTSI